MKTYLFNYGNSEICGKIQAEVSEAEEKLMLQAAEHRFDNLEDDSDMKALRKRIFTEIAKQEAVSDDDILWIHIPYEIVEKVMYEK